LKYKKPVKTFRDFLFFSGMEKIATNTTNSTRTQATGVRLSSYQFGATRSYAMNCKQATPSVWGNLTGMCFCSNAKVQSSPGQCEEIQKSTLDNLLR